MHPTLRLLSRAKRYKVAHNIVPGRRTKKPAEDRHVLPPNNTIQSTGGQAAGAAPIRLLFDPAEARGQGMPPVGGFRGRSTGRPGHGTGPPPPSRAGLDSSWPPAPGTTGTRRAGEEWFANALEPRRAAGQEEAGQAVRGQPDSRWRPARAEQIRLGQLFRERQVWRLCNHILVELTDLKNIRATTEKMMRRAYAGALPVDRRISEVEKCIDQTEKATEKLLVCQIAALESMTYWAAHKAWASVRARAGAAAPGSMTLGNVEPKWIETPYAKKSKNARKKRKAAGKEARDASMFPTRLAVWWRSGYLVAREHGYARDDMPFALLPVDHDAQYGPYGRAVGLALKTERVKAEAILSRHHRALGHIMGMHKNMITRSFEEKLYSQMRRKTLKTQAQQAQE